MDPTQSSVLLDIVLNCRKPIVLRKFGPNWKCFDCSLKEWCNKFDAVPSHGEQALFERMPIKFGDSPQWERYRSKIGITFTDFLDVYSEDSENWTAFNYQQAKEIPLECRHDVDFSCFGFTQLAKDASFWLSSKGANTPCHFDTYGCNIVVQVYGRKHWLLFPPETQFTPTRIPYEESSVYCLENFFSPKNIDSLAVARHNALECVLGEGDVLIVPRNWWHYVESLDTSLSVNAWIPLEMDIDAQIEECIVKYIIEKCVNGEPEENVQYFLNPNQLINSKLCFHKEAQNSTSDANLKMFFRAKNLELITSSEELFKILRFLLERRSVTGKTISDKPEDTKYPSEYLSDAEVSELIQTSQCDISVLEALDPCKFDNIMHEKTKRYIDMELPDTLTTDPMHAALLNAICHPKVIKMIKDKFLTYCSSN